MTNKIAKISRPSEQSLGLFHYRSTCKIRDCADNLDMQPAHRISHIFFIVVVLVLFSVNASIAQAQDDAETPAQREVRRTTERAEAHALLKTVIEAYRSAPLLEVSTTVSVLAEGAAAAANARTSKADFQFVVGREGVLTFNGSTLHLRGGKIRAFHASNTESYVEAADDGSPFYALFNAFGDLPFLEIALALGEDSVEDVCMQLQSHAPDVVPSLVTRRLAADGSVETLQLFLEAEGQRIECEIDPKTKLVRASVTTVTEGAETEDGTTLVWKTSSTFARAEEVLPQEELWPDVGARQKVDGLQSLIKRPPPRESDDANDDGGGDQDGAGAPAASDAPKVGDAAPEFELPQLDATNCSLKSLRGKFVLLDFWATWCGPCRAAMPAMTAMLQDLHGVCVGVLVNSGEQGSVEDRKTRVRAVLETAKVPLTGEHAERVLLDLDGAAARSYGVRAFPTILLVSPEGVIVERFEGWSKSAETKIRAAVTAKKPAPKDGA